MKSFDPDFSLRAYFQVKYENVIDVRASKLIPYLSIHDSNFVQDPYTGQISWVNPGIPLEPLQEEQSSEVGVQLHYRSPQSNTPETSTISTRTDTSSHSTSSSKSSPHLSCLRKRQRANLLEDEEDSSIKKRKAAYLTAKAGPSEHPAIPQWDKSLLFRLNPYTFTTVLDLRYTYVKLPAPDVEACAIAICAKMGIPYSKGMRISWTDSKTSLRGPFDHAFLWTVADMQDFVINIVDTSHDGTLELLLAM